MAAGSGVSKGMPAGTVRWERPVRSSFGAGEQTAGHQGERGQRGQGVVLLAGGDGEEAEDEAGPEEEGEGGLTFADFATRLFWRHSSAVMHRVAGKHEDCFVQVAKVLADGAGEEGDPGEDPDGGEQPEERDGDLAVVVRDAAGEEAGDVFVVEIEPGPASVCGQAEAGRQRDGRIAERGEDVPRRGDRKEDQRGGDEVELPEQAELAGDQEVEEDEAEREDEADEALGEEVEGGDGGEGEAGKKGRVAQLPDCRVVS